MIFFTFKFKYTHSIRQRTKTLKKIALNKEITFETRHRKKNGEILQIRVSANHIRIRDIDYIAAIWSDITENRRAQEILNQTQARLSSFMQHVPAKILIKDHEYRVIYANEKMTEAFPIDQWMGKDLIRSSQRN